jgi:hypothetical protein
VTRDKPLQFDRVSALDEQGDECDGKPTALMADACDFGTNHIYYKSTP